MSTLATVPADYYVVIVAPADEQRIAPLLRDTKWKLFAGEATDNLHRFVEAAKAYPADYIIRATDSSPAVSYELALGLLKRIPLHPSYVAFQNTVQGISPELISTGALFYAHARAKRYSDRHQVVSYIRDTAPDVYLLDVSAQYAISCCSALLETPADYEKVQDLFNNCYRNEPLTLDQISGWCRVYYVTRLQVGGCA